MVDRRARRREPAEFVQFWAAGASAKGAYRCSECGYGVTVHQTLPVCPMCGGGSWEAASWRPLRSALEALDDAVGRPRLH
jgi:hypothetical protein